MSLVSKSRSYTIHLFAGVTADGLGADVPTSRRHSVPNLNLLKAEKLVFSATSPRPRISSQSGPAFPGARMMIPCTQRNILRQQEILPAGPTSPASTARHDTGLPRIESRSQRPPTFDLYDGQFTPCDVLCLM